MQILKQLRDTGTALAQTRDQLSATSTDVRQALNAATLSFALVAALAIIALATAAAALKRAK